MRGVIASACCHPVINTGMEISADYPQVLTRKALEEYGVPFLFLQGRGADINPLVPEDMSIHDAMEMLGKELTNGVINAIGKAMKTSDQADSISSIYRLASIPMKPFPLPEEAEKIFKASLQRYMEIPWSVDKHYALRELEWHRKMYEKAKLTKGNGENICAPVQVFTIGKRLIFVFLSFEVLTNTGNKIEILLRQMGYEEENIFVIGYANSVNGYLAPYEELAVGGYEVTGASHWYGLPECGELTEKTVIETVKEMTLLL